MAEEEENQREESGRGRSSWMSNSQYLHGCEWVFIICVALLVAHPPPRHA